MQLLQTGKWCSGLSVVHISALEQSKWCSRLSVGHIFACEGALGLPPGSPPGAPGSPQGSPRGSLVILQWTYGSKLLVSPCLLRNHYYAIRVILCSVVSLYVLFFAKPRVSRGSWMHSPVYKRMGGGVYMGSGPPLLVKLGGPRFDDERA